MKILVCPDKFKGSLTAREVCEAVEEGLRGALPGADVISMPLADGGEGTCALLTEWYAGRMVEIQVHGPLFKKVTARYGISGNGDTAFIEMAEASGLMLLDSEQQNPLNTTSLGTGEMIRDALDKGVRHIILGIGGSATNDAGIGMATALGYSFYDASGSLLSPIGENLIHIRHIDVKQADPRLRQVEVTALCDVTNPLYGPEGAAYVYGPQKGANDVAVEILDAGLRNFRKVVHKQFRTSVDFPGAGAAGGLGAGARVFLYAEMRRGVSYIIERGGLADKVREADLIITGEGKIDDQTFSGKVVSEIIRLSIETRKPVYAVCGRSEMTEQEVQARGLRKILSLVDAATSPEEAIKNARQYIQSRIRQAFGDGAPA